MPVEQVSGWSSCGGRAMAQRAVLAEDDYLHMVGAIIERDFFPDLAAANAAAAARAAADDAADGAPVPADDAPPEGLSLDTFFAHFTSDDNASFAALQARDKLRAAHAAGQDAGAAKNPPSQQGILLLTDRAASDSASETDRTGATPFAGSEIMALEDATSKARELLALMPPPSPRDALALRIKRARKSINYRGTSMPGSEILRPHLAAAAAGAAGAAGAAAAGTSAAPLPPGAVRGTGTDMGKPYSYVMTPSSTADASETPRSDRHGGGGGGGGSTGIKRRRSQRRPNGNADAYGLTRASTTSGSIFGQRKLKRRAGGQGASATSVSGSATPGMASLTPAARRLAHRSMGIRIGVGSALRSRTRHGSRGSQRARRGAGSSSVVRSRGSEIGDVPAWPSVSPASSVGSVSRSRSRSQSRPRYSSRADGDGSTSRDDITDNLLHLPS